LLACLLEAQDSTELCYKTIKRKLKSRAMNLPNIAVPRSATTGEIVAADGGRRLCWTIVGKQWQPLSFFFPLAAQSPPGWLVCVVPVIFIWIFFWRIIEFLAPDFYFSKMAGYHYKQCFLFSVL
jgi:hypothetical protein